MKKIDPDLIKKMMMGDYAPSESKKEDHKPKKSAQSAKAIHVIDLHAEKLFVNSQPQPHELLAAQLKAMDEYIESAFKKRISRIIIIHGKGENILKKSVHNRLKSNNKVAEYLQINDLPYLGGATRVRLI